MKKTRTANNELKPNGIGNGLRSIAEALPETPGFVVALTSTFRCLASYARDGIWRDAKSGEVVEGVIAWRQVWD